jgi:phosphoribosylamine--glycine ligase
LQISGINDATASGNALLFHCGTKSSDGKILTNGGRVLAATGFGPDIKSAINNSVKTLKNVSFEGMYFRSDIGFEF